MTQTPIEPPGPALRAPLRRPLRIGDLEIAGPAVQAALSGYSDRAMRRVARAHGAPYCLHEVVVDKLLLQPGKLQRQILSVETDDHPIGGQIMGAEPVVFGKAARLMADAGFDVVDLNFGCPVPKVLGRCRGGFLVGDPPTALEMIDRVLEAVAGDVPVSVKMRRGIDDSADAERGFFSILEGAFERGVAAVTVHPRTVEQRYVGPSDWEFLARVRRHLGDGPVLLGSGDLFTAADCLEMIARTGVDGVTVARGCIGNPWIFAQVADLLAGRVPTAPSLGEQRAALEQHWRESLADHGDGKGPSRARNHAIKYAALHPDGEAVQDAFVAVRGEAAFRAVLERHYPAERAAERAGDAIDLAAAAHRLKSCGVAGGRVASPSLTKLLLVSNSTQHGSGYLEHCEDRVVEHFRSAGAQTIWFVPYALHDLDAYTATARAAFERMGFQLRSVHEVDDPAAAAAEAEGFFVGGGNTFRLLKRVREERLIEAIRQRVAGGAPYLGTSAGSNLACPTVRTTNDMPIVEPGSFAALDLAPFQINPHYLDPPTDSRHMGETREQRIREFHEENQTPVVGLREGGMLLCGSGRTVLAGPPAARIFRRGQEPVEVASGEDLAPLVGAPA